MNLKHWEVKDNMGLRAVNNNSEITKSGIPMAYDEENLYINSGNNHTLVIGSTGSGKTQVMTLPLLELSRRAGESVVVHDTKNELYDATAEKFKESGYNIIKLNFDDARESNSWNPLELPNRLFKEGNVDKSQDLIEDLGFYLLNELTEVNSDPFWSNSAISYFTGLVLYLFNNEESVSLTNIKDLDIKVQENPEEFIKGIDKYSNIYTYLSSILNAPPETRGSIFSVFSQKIKRYISKNNLLNILSKNDFDLSLISKEKTIIYIQTGNSNNSERLMPLLISQVYYAKDEYSEKDGLINIIIDDFFNFYPFKDFGKMLNYSRGINIAFTIMIRGFNDLENCYGKEVTNIIKLCFNNIIYLLSQDIATLEEFSRLCGKVEDKPLITFEELKTLSIFEAIILTPRSMPFRTKLLPYYQMKI